MTATVTIVGAGPAGLAAAIAIAHRGGRARVVERRAEVGARFHGDFEGLENWSAVGDVLAELAGRGIEPTFDHHPCRECVFFDDAGREYECRSPEPFWYLVRRGPGEGTLDRSLEHQAIAAGVELEKGTAVDHLPDGGIVTHGPRRADVIAVGYVGRTETADGAYGVLSHALAPRGYAYLLIWRGEATLATCLFDDFHNERIYLDRTVEFFRDRVGLTLTMAKRFGGFGNVSPTPHLRRGELLFAGEAAGLQDALLGFGMRFALASGHLAGVAFAEGDLGSYERGCAQRFAPLLRAAIVNRFFYDYAGERLGRRLLQRVAAAHDQHAWLRSYYGPRWWTPFVYPLARTHARHRHERSLELACRGDCDCTWCKCRRSGGGENLERESPGASP